MQASAVALFSHEDTSQRLEGLIDDSEESPPHLEHAAVDSRNGMMSHMRFNLIELAGSADHIDFAAL